MRDLLYRNLTSPDKKRKIIATTEVVDKEGIHRVIQRHFAYLVKEVTDKYNSKPLPYIYVLKESNNNHHREKFFCRIKGSVYLEQENRLFLIVFMHSLKISLEAIPQPTSY